MKKIHPRTTEVNKTQQTLSLQARKKALVWLQKKYPEVFDNTFSIRPLKIGIFLDIVKDAGSAMEEDEISRSKLKQALVFYTRQMEYLACLKAREMRIDLQGRPTVMVTKEEAQNAALKMKIRVENHLKKISKNLKKNERGLQNKQTLYKEKKEVLRTSNHIVAPLTSFCMQQSTEDAFLSCDEKAPTIEKAASVLVTHKNTRPFDPDAVARLKEKLGLGLSENALARIKKTEE